MAAPPVLVLPDNAREKEKHYTKLSDILPTGFRCSTPEPRAPGDPFHQ